MTLFKNCFVFKFSIYKKEEKKTKKTLGYCPVKNSDERSRAILTLLLFCFLCDRELFLCVSGIPQIALATKIDKVCSHVEEDLSSVFKSDAVCEVVENVSQILGFPRGHVLPMKNYEREIETSNDVSILALISLRQMLRATEDYMFNCLDELQDLSMGSEDGQLSQ